MDEIFARLREHLDIQDRNDGWKEYLCDLLQEAYQQDEITYQELCIPYCESHLSDLESPIRTITSITDLEYWSTICPFATFSYTMNQGNQQDLENIVSHELSWNLQELYFSYNRIAADGCRAITNSEYLINLQVLHLGITSIGNEGCRILAESQNLRNLRELDLTSSHIEVIGCQYIANSENFQNLVYLGLDMNNIGDDGCALIADSQNLRNLQELSLRSTNIGPSGCRFVMNKEYADGPQVIDLGENNIGRDGIVSRDGNFYEVRGHELLRSVTL